MGICPNFLPQIVGESHQEDLKGIMNAERVSYKPSKRPASELVPKLQFKVMSHHG